MNCYEIVKATFENVKYIATLKLLAVSLLPRQSLCHEFEILPMDTAHGGTWWRLGRDDDFQPEVNGFDSRSSRYVGTLGKSFTCSCLCASA